MDKLKRDVFMLKLSIENALNKQINAELYSAYLYQSMAAYCESIKRPGIAHWMDEQVKEEVTHAMRLYRYVTDAGGRVILSAIEQPPTEWPAPLDVFEYTLNHEKKVTGLINDLVNLAIQENDDETKKMLQWFVDEQVEEEESANKVLQIVKSAGNDESGLAKADKELGKRKVK